MNYNEEIETIRNSGILFDPVLVQLIENTLSIINDRNLYGMDITDTPISPSLIEDDEIEVILSEEVTKEYQDLVQMINDSSTALEYPMILLGKLKEKDGIRFYVIEKIIYCHSSESQLSSRVVSYDQNKLNEALANATREGYTFISLAHTHPNIPQEERTNTISEYLSQDIKGQFDIRDAGLNISLQDLVQYESIYRYFISNPNVRTFETVIMYNGEIAMFGKADNKYKKISNIYNGLTFDNIPVFRHRELGNKEGMVNQKWK